ncbi:LysM domain-containing protein OS=Streptomyces antimycoticus OX=68175 GN=SSPO_088440 PE=4 SV=1 [Streptomyces antimycoticus]
MSVFRGIRPARLALLSPDVPDTLILTEVTS